MNRRTFLSLVAFASAAIAIWGCGISCRTSTVDPKTVLVGTTGDYRPLSYREPETGEYWGFCLDVAGEIAKAMDATVSYVPTSWPTLTADVLPYLQNLADTLTLRLIFDGKLVSMPKGPTTALPIDLVGQLAEDAFIRLAGASAPSPENMKHLNALLDFTAKLLPRLSEGAQQSLLDRRLDGFFLTGNYDGAIALLDKGLPSHTPGWCKGTAAKLRYHRFLADSKKDAALKQLLIFIDFMLSDEQKDFEDCDPTTGIIYSREWVVGKNYLRCRDLARDLKDATLEADYFKKAKELYATALKKAKDDPKALAELKKEAQAVGL